MTKTLVMLTAAAGLSVPFLAGAQVKEEAATPDAVSHNALIRKHCVVCHQGRNPGGGLSLESFDLRRPDAAVARMMAIKITDDGAMTAAGVPKPDPATYDSFIAALSEAGAEPTHDGWTVDLAIDPKAPSRGHALVTARTTGTVSGRPAGAPEYQLTLACNGATRKGEMQLATYEITSSPASKVPRTMPEGGAAGAAFSYAVDGLPKQDARLSPAGAHAGSTGSLSPFPTYTLMVADLFPNETVAFSIDRLSPTVRQMLASCSSSSQP